MDGSATVIADQCSRATHKQPAVGSCVGVKDADPRLCKGAGRQLANLRAQCPPALQARQARQQAYQPRKGTARIPL